MTGDFKMVPSIIGSCVARFSRTVFYERIPVANSNRSIVQILRSWSIEAVTQYPNCLDDEPVNLQF
jgi:hypothetical protein